jgi:hypothetical protein
MESQQHRAYNQTRGCFLGLDVVAGDFSGAVLNDWTSVLTPNSGAGLWIVPFRGIASTDLKVPLDLAYLDEDCRVIDVVEFFPTFRVSPSCPPAASILALPIHSIYSTQTQPGDQLILCAAEEITWRLEQLSSASGVAGPVPGAVRGPVLVKRAEPRSAGIGLQESAGPGPLQAEDLSTEQRPESHQAHENINIEPGKKIRPPRSWLIRWLFPGPPNRRKASRRPAPGLAVNFWTGGPPQAHSIRDVSATGLYVVTAERWYPGTLVRLTLTNTDSEEQPAERSITVGARAIRWGNDGVGLEFVLQKAQKLRRGQPSTFGGVDRTQLDQFLKHFRAAAAGGANHATRQSALECPAYTAGRVRVMPENPLTPVWPQASRDSSGGR